MVNMDMVGRLTDNKLEISGTGTATSFNELIDRLNEKYRFALTKKPEGVGPSDHASFFEEKIPVFHFFTGLHNDYHRPSDDWDKINVPGMVRIVDMMSDVIETIATAPERPEFVPVSGPANPFAAPREQGRLQVELKEDSMEIASLESNGAGEKAGLQVGDVVKEVAGKPVADRDSLRQSLAGKRPNAKVKVVVERQGKKVELEVSLGK